MGTRYTIDTITALRSGVGNSLDVASALSLDDRGKKVFVDVMGGACGDQQLMHFGRSGFG